MNAPAWPRPSERSKGEPELVRLRKVAWTNTGIVLFGYALSALTIWGWWYAQVTGKQETSGKGFVEGSPFPWWILLVTVSATFLIMSAVDAWRDYRRLRDKKRRLQAPSNPHRPTT